MNTQTPIAPTADAGELQGRIAAVAELLVGYCSDHAAGISPLARLLTDLRLLADARELDFFTALDVSYFAYLTAKTPFVKHAGPPVQRPYGRRAGDTEQGVSRGKREST